MAQYTFDTLKDFELAGISLPSGYTKLNYIENQGNASTYIDTNYVANGNTTLRALVSINTTGYNSMGYIGTYRYGFNLTGSLLYSYVNNGSYTYAINTQIGQKRLIEIDNITKSVSLDGVVIGTLATISYPIGGTYWIGRLNNHNSEYFNGKIYYHEFLENGVSVQKLIPCEDGNGNIGMYDVVTETFFANQGTNPFMSGGNAPSITPIAGDTATITELGLTMTYNDGYFRIVDNQTLTLSQATQLFSFAKGDNGVTATITDLGLTLTSNGTDWYVTNNITIPTFSQATQLFSFAKGDNGVTATITDLGITLTSNGTDWYVTSDITIPTFSQATQLFSFAKGDNSVTVTVTSTGGVYKYEGDDWHLWYTIIPPLVFKGITFEQTDFWQIPEMVFRGMSFEQTDFWQIPEMVFRGISFEITDKVGGASMFHGMV